MGKFGVQVFILLVFLLIPAPFVFAAAPTLNLISPQEGDVVKGYIVNVKFEAKNFVLKDHRSVTKNVSGQGHLLLWLDGPDSLDPTTARKWSRESDYSFADVKTGEHTLRAALVGNDNQMLEPGVLRTVHFRTEADEITSRPVQGLVSTVSAVRGSQAKFSFPSAVKKPLIITLFTLGLGLAALLALKRF